MTRGLNIPDGDGSLLGVLASWTGKIWAVGTNGYASPPNVHWNGSSWS